MKGQFFISSIVVIAIILIVSMTYANSAEELRIESGNDLNFENYKNAYERAVPDDWEFVEYVNRTKIGICLIGTSDTQKLNTTIEFTSSDGISSCNELRAEAGVNIYSDVTSVPCWILIQPDEFAGLVNSQKCTEFYIYSGFSGSITTSSPVSSISINGTKFYTESIANSPVKEFGNKYREKNIFVNETSSTNKIYNVSYRSNRIDYTGEL